MKLDKIIFTDSENKVDFYIEKDGKVYARTHTAFKSDDGKSGFLGRALIFTITAGVETIAFRNFSISLMLLIIFIALISAIVTSYFVERYTLRK